MRPQAPPTPSPQPHHLAPGRRYEMHIPRPRWPHRVRNSEWGLGWILSLEVSKAEGGFEVTKAESHCGHPGAQVLGSWLSYCLPVGAFSGNACTCATTRVRVGSQSPPVRRHGLQPQHSDLQMRHLKGSNPTDLKISPKQMIPRLGPRLSFSSPPHHPRALAGCPAPPTDPAPAPCCEGLGWGC